ncbi:MAG: hypothetical protein WA510_26725 [Acidobacteriaceae bacterium]
MNPDSFPLGTVIAERFIKLYAQDDEERRIAVRLGLPVRTRLDGTVLGPQDPSEELFRCPFQILGLEIDERVYAPFGEDPFVALQYAIDMIGDLLARQCEHLGLLNKCAFSPLTRDHWIWRYSD